MTSDGFPPTCQRNESDAAKRGGSGCSAKRWRKGSRKAQDIVQEKVMVASNSVKNRGGMGVERRSAEMAAQVLVSQAVES
jgi:hypothetical protein